jgi:hypothetical protein
MIHTRTAVVVLFGLAAAILVLGSVALGAGIRAAEARRLRSV